MRDKAYYATVRTEILPLLQKTPDATVLDIGCGTGATLGYLKEKGYCGTSVGVEMFPDCWQEARNALEEFHPSKVEDVSFASGRFDLVLLLDVLEHTPEPEAMLQRVRPWLKPTGQLVVSLPNIRNQAVLRKLVLHGRWDYQDSGILDRSHLKFFTLKSARDLFHGCGYHVMREHHNYDKGVPALILRCLPFMRELAVAQFLFLLSAS